MKVHLEKLLIIQSDYWSQRCTIRWVQLNGENTKYFHAKATERFRHNTISTIMDGEGRTLVEHQEKAAAFWNCFKGRMGVSNSIATPYNLSSFLPTVDNLDHLANTFTETEIENVMKILKSDKAPGPDGFTGAFVKKVLAYY